MSRGRGRIEGADEVLGMEDWCDNKVDGVTTGVGNGGDGMEDDGYTHSTQQRHRRSEA